MIPKYLVPVIWPGSFETLSGILRTMPDGTFAFFYFQKAKTDTAGNPVTWENAMMNCARNEELAKAYMQMRDESKLGILISKHGGSLVRSQMPMSRALRFTSIERLIHDMVQVGKLPIDPEKLFEPASLYV